MRPDLYWPTGVLLALTVLTLSGFSSNSNKNLGERFLFVVEILGLLALPLLLVLAGWVTLGTALWISCGLALLMLVLIVGADMNRPAGSALSTGLQLLFMPFAAVFMLLFLACSWLFKKR
jgi:hypothetical protein